MQGSALLYCPSECYNLIYLYILNPSVLQWVLDGLNPEKKQNVNTKKLEALKRLGHSSLKLDEYERAFHR